MYNHYEGDSYRNRAKLEAYAILENIHYEGEQKGFTFEKFVEKHNECYLELSCHNEPLYKEKKVRDFLNCIHAPELQAAKQQVRANEQMMGSFQLAANFIALSVTPAKQSSRQIAATHTDKISPCGRGGRGRGGRGSHAGRYNNAGRGHNRGRNPGNHQGCGNGGRKSGGRGGNHNTGYYAEEDWAALTREQKDNILKARGNKQNIGALETDDAQQQGTADNDNIATVANGNNNARITSACYTLINVR
jgi:hypothetical protein